MTTKIFDKLYSKLKEEAINSPILMTDAHVHQLARLTFLILYVLIVLLWHLRLKD